MTEAGFSVLGKENIFDLVGKEWMLITAGTQGSFNTMTASWGGLGWLWNKPVAIFFVRPERFTHQFIEAADLVTLSFYPESCRKALQICGTISGRDSDKVSEAGLNPVPTPEGAVTFSQARLTLVCRKLFRTDMKEGDFVDSNLLNRWYGEAEGGLHTIYFAEIEKVYQKD